MLITFEGIDGCGKSTQAKLLSDYLIAKNKKVKILREPGGTLVSESIREILLNSTNNINYITELLLFEAARSEIVEKIIRKDLNENMFVICDRFFDSTTAYQGYGRNLSMEHIKLLNQLATGGLKPNITFFLDVSLEIAKKRTKKILKDRMELSGDDFFERVIYGYHQIAREEPERFVIVNADGNIEHTQNEIMQYFLERNTI